MKSAVSIRHVAFEDAGVLEDVLPDFGYRLTYLDAGTDDLEPAVDADLLIVMGGPLGVYDQPDYPFLTDELAVLRRRLAANRPTLGICLGAQLVAAALGASVHKGGAGKEIGWKPLTLHGPTLAELENLPVLHWHGDTWTAADWTSPASTDQYPNQAFAVGSHVLGLQFHCEVKAKTFEKWLVGNACDLAVAGISPVSLRADAKLYAADLERAGSALFRRWLAGLD